MLKLLCWFLGSTYLTPSLLCRKSKSGRFFISYNLIFLHLYGYKLCWTLCKGKQNPHACQTVDCHSHHIIALCLWVYTQSQFLCHKWKHHTLSVTLANASGVSKYQTQRLIASIFLYLRAVQCSQLADSSLKALAIEFSIPPDNNNLNRYGHWSK